MDSSPSTATTAAVTESTSTTLTIIDPAVIIGLGALVGGCVGVILLLLSLIVLLYYKLTKQSQVSTAVTDTVLPLRDNQAYGKAEPSISSLPEGEQSTELLYECIPDTTPRAVTRSDSSSSEHYYY